MPDWKDTVNLPRTGFPMKANLQTAEPEAIARWEAMDLYAQIQERRKGAPAFLLHDGPPYANGQIHLGTALNKILKDLVIRSKSMAGFSVPFVPGYDCHGLPIELRVDRELGPKKREMSRADIRRACRAYAQRFIGVMTDEFKRLGVMGEWHHPYLTMDYRYQADIVRALGRFVEQGLVYKGKKPRPRWNTRTTPRRPSTWSFCWRPTARPRSPSGCRPWRESRSRSSSGPPRRGPYRPTSASRFIPSSTTGPTTWTVGP
jgi:isoleucyl-tRNA synthetase